MYIIYIQSDLPYQVWTSFVRIIISFSYNINQSLIFKLKLDIKYTFLNIINIFSDIQFWVEQCVIWFITIMIWCCKTVIFESIFKYTSIFNLVGDILKKIVYVYYLGQIRNYK